MVAITHLVCFPSFLRELMLCPPPILVWCFDGLFVWVFPGRLETGQCHPNSETSTVLLCCQLPTDFHNISIVYTVVHVQSSLESGEEARIMHINFSAAFHRVNHQGILYKLCSVGIGGSVLSILTWFLSNRSQHVMVDGCQE